MAGRLLLRPDDGDDVVVTSRPDNVDLPQCPAATVDLVGRDPGYQEERDDTCTPLLGSCPYCSRGRRVIGSPV